MATKIIVSYDGTDNDRDALALGRVLADAGASLELAYVRHAHESETARERLAEGEAQELLEAGAEELGAPDVPKHVVLSGSTPEGLRDLALRVDAGMIVFGSEYRTAKGHVDPQASARRLLDGGPIALGLAPAGFHELNGYTVGTVGAVGEEGDPCVLETAEALAARLGGVVAPKATADVSLMVVGSKPGTVTGRVTISAAAEYLIELARCPVVVLPRGVAVAFG
jgi:nucleotide-binding universal stress UspA family protein